MWEVASCNPGPSAPEDYAAQAGGPGRFRLQVDRQTLTRKYFRIFPSCVGARACYKSYNGPIDLRVKQREFMSLVGGAAVNWPLWRNAASRADATGFA